jgi:hypothetical protein
LLALERGELARLRRRTFWGLAELLTLPGDKRDARRRARRVTAWSDPEMRRKTALKFWEESYRRDEGNPGPLYRLMCGAWLGHVATLPETDPLRRTTLARVAKHEAAFARQGWVAALPSRTTARKYRER